MWALSRAERISSSRIEGRSACAMGCAKKESLFLSANWYQLSYSESKHIYIDVVLRHLVALCVSFPCIHLPSVLLTLTVLELKI